MTNIQIASDLHLEHLDENIDFNLIITPNKNADILILAGDIGYPHNIQYLKFLKFCSENWKRTLLIMGNHEYYHHTFEEIDAQIDKLKRLFINVYFLHCSEYYHENLIFLGCTLWSHVLPKTKSKMSDYVNIEDINLEKLNNIAHQQYSWLKNRIEYYSSNPIFNDCKIVVISHHLPSYSCISELFIGDPYNDAYANHYDDLCSMVDTWIFGHSHSSNYKKINDCLCVSNPLGYLLSENTFENPDYSKNLTINL